MKQISFVLLSALFAAPAFAQDEPQVIYKDKTEIDFEAVDIEGQLKKPQGQLLLERAKADFNPMIELREDFNLEMTQSVNDIK